MLINLNDSKMNIKNLCKAVCYISVLKKKVKNKNSISLIN